MNTPSSHPPAETPAALASPAAEVGLRVLYESSGVLAVHKPAGLPTQAVVGVDSLEARVRRLLASREEHHYLGVPHRLDRCVSGVMLFATTRRAARQLSRQFERRVITKCYLALTELPAAGTLPKVGDRWEDLLAKVAGEPRGVVATADHPLAKEARTRVAGVSRREASLVLRLQPETGRMHQLRIQSAQRGMPIVGDRLYGSTQPLRGGAVPTDQRQEEIALAAIAIAFRDPGRAGEPHTQVRREITAWPWWADPLELDAASSSQT